MKWQTFFFLSLLIGILVTIISCGKEYSCEDCYSLSNRKPIADAGADTALFLPADSAILNGTASHDPDGTIDKYVWRQISGPGTSLLTQASGVSTIVKNLSLGIYQFELIITDNLGLTARDTVSVSVINNGQYNRPPLAKAGADQSVDLPMNSITLDGSNSTDPDNNILSYSWTKISGPNGLNIRNSTLVQTQVTDMVEGFYRFELQVTDAAGLSSKDTVVIRVNEPPSSPVAAVYAGPDIILTLPLDSVYLHGKWSGSQNSDWEWIKIYGQGGGNISADNMLFPGLVVARNLQPGLYTFRFTLKGQGPGSSDTMTVEVIDDPQERNTITFQNLKWRMADEYGIGILDLDVVAPAQPNLFSAWNQMIPSIVYLQPDPLMQWMALPFSDSFSSFVYDFASPHIWIMRTPAASTWVGRESSVKIKLL